MCWQCPLFSHLASTILLAAAQMNQVGRHHPRVSRPVLPMNTIPQVQAPSAFWDSTLSEPKPDTNASSPYGHRSLSQMCERICEHDAKLLPNCVEKQICSNNRVNRYDTCELVRLTVLLDSLVWANRVASFYTCVCHWYVLPLFITWHVLSRFRMQVTTALPTCERHVTCTTTH